MISGSTSLQSSSPTKSGTIFDENDDVIYDPKALSDGKIPFPDSLSPSAAAEFKACPQSYLIQYLYKIKQPANLALAKGSMCHKALESVYDLSPEDRSLEQLQNLLRKSWSEVRFGNTYSHLFAIANSKDDKNHVTSQENDEPERDVKAEREWGQSALQLLKNYYEMEDPRLIPPPNPIEREVWVRYNLMVDPLKGVTGYASSTQQSDNEVSNDNNSFLVRGIVDRIDLVGLNSYNTNDDDDTSPEMALRIIDYKTGKAPDFKYSRAMNEKIANENMWQLKIYALLLREMLANEKGSKILRDLSTVNLRQLRLMYLTNVDGSGQYLDMDLGETQEERDEVLQEVHADLSKIW
eukprot:CAMPEP_0184854900 /NCGR_PEP_ID=MMETSP0580-20130426/275_1 /TAXON_ID=1118495 /ORGANISM="Dactyliosolen fragilissimus" /LENGTH=351 /DNA_ID=CAMNT_0027349271 /DNA_START=281 /DNA_END=1333 /DNA_ORIENTATION=-